jgi:hypothetical protein
MEGGEMDIDEILFCVMVLLALFVIGMLWTGVI